MSDYETIGRAYSGKALDAQRWVINVVEKALGDLNIHEHDEEDILLSLNMIKQALAIADLLDVRTHIVNRIEWPTTQPTTEVTP